MTNKLLYCMGVILLIVSWSFASDAPTAAAQSVTSKNGEACRTCHESLYLLHDTGKSFCLCAQEMTCTCCHGGDPAALTEVEAHEGMALSPVHGDAMPCQQCHAEDAEARVDQFAAVAGVSSFHSPASTQTTFVAAFVVLPAAPGLLHWLDTWQWIGLGALAVGLVALVIFGYRCWRADCLPKIQKSHS